MSADVKLERTLPEPLIVQDKLAKCQAMQKRIRSEYQRSMKVNPEQVPNLGREVAESYVLAYHFEYDNFIRQCVVEVKFKQNPDQ